MILYSLENIFDIIKNNLKVSFSLSLLFMLIALTINSNSVFSKSLSTGLHRIRNQRTGTILYVNSDGRIVVTSNDNNSSLNEIRDAFTKEIKYVTKIIKSNHTSKYYNNSDTEGVGAYITDDLILGSTSYYDENGNTINIGDKNITFAFNNYLFFSDGTVYDTFMQTNFNLNGINDESLILNDLNPDFVSIIYIKNKPFLIRKMTLIIPPIKRTYCQRIQLKNGLEISCCNQTL